MDTQTRAAFIEHVRLLETAACAGDATAVKSLACMALLREGDAPDDPNGGEVIDFAPYLKLVA
jgi:hypothetical protein